MIGWVNYVSVFIYCVYTKATTEPITTSSKHNDSSACCYRLFHGCADSDSRLCFMAAKFLPGLRLEASMASNILSLMERGPLAAGKGGGHSFGLEAHWSEREEEAGRER